jgi:hypothetical protein
MLRGQPRQAPCIGQQRYRLRRQAVRQVVLQHDARAHMQDGRGATAIGDRIAKPDCAGARDRCRRGRVADQHAPQRVTNCQRSAGIDRDVLFKDGARRHSQTYRTQLWAKRLHVRPQANSVQPAQDGKRIPHGQIQISRQCQHRPGCSWSTKRRAGHKSESKLSVEKVR